jgi:hypothetical protein
MSEELTLRHILSIEDPDGLTDFVCPETGVPLWSLIRSVFVSLIMADKLYDAPIVTEDGANGALGGASRLKKASLIARSFLHNAGAPCGDSPVVVMASGARLARQDKYYFNCLGDYFVSAAPAQTLLIEEMFKWRWPFPRRHRKMILHTPLRVIGAVNGKLNADARRADSRALVDMACARAKELLGFEASHAQREWLVRLCSTAAGSLPARIASYRSIFTRAGARVLVKEEACYGGPDNVSAMIAAKQLGMATAEYQHGSISSGHAAYNFGASVHASQSYRRTLPEHFLSFGAWWSGQVDAPVKHVPVGSPHRATVVGATSTASAQRRILVLGDGIDTKAYLALAADLAAQLGDGFEVVFRPQPLERSTVFGAYPGEGVGAVRFDRNQDIYQSFQTCSAVVSEVSTGLFEAVGLVNSIFIWDTPKSRFAYPSHPFCRFDSAGGLADAVRDGRGAVGNDQNDQIWAPGWEARYTEFLRSVGAVGAGAGRQTTC